MNVSALACVLILPALMAPELPASANRRSCAEPERAAIQTGGRLVVCPGANYGSVEIRNDCERSVHFRVSQIATDAQDSCEREFASTSGREFIGEYTLEAGGKVEIKTHLGCPGGSEPRLELERLPDSDNPLSSGTLSDVLYPAGKPPVDPMGDPFPCPHGNETRNRWLKPRVRPEPGGARGASAA